MKRTILTNISEVVTPEGKNALHGKDMGKVKRLKDAAIVLENGKILAVGPNETIIKQYVEEDTVIQDKSGSCVLPGFVDSHTHFIFGGYRPDEFMMRLKGASYLEIHKAGGGIWNTVQATRNMGLDEMVQTGKERLEDMLSMGVTTAEGKSGYGLDRECELRQLEALEILKKEQPVSLVRTFLGAHSIPEEYKGRSDEYIDFLIKEMLPLVKEKNLAEYVDIFCESSVFNCEQSRRYLLAAKEMGFGVKIHADEIEALGGSGLAAEIGAVSADHLLMIRKKDCEKLDASSTVATLLPATAFCLHKPYAPARELIDGGCAVALASDYNPGSCFTNSIPLLFALAVIHMNMSLEETLCALTLNGAAAVGKADQIGSIEPGKAADLVVLEKPQYEFLVYHTGKNIVKEVYKDGMLAYSKR